MPQLTPQQLSKTVRYQQAPPLTVVIGPFDHPHAGFIPEGFKILQVKGNRFHYFRQINGEWIQYGNGKDAWYAISWDTVGRWLRDFSKKDTRPLGIGGAISPFYAKIDVDTATDDYSLEDHLRYMPVDIRGVFERLRKRILNLDTSVTEEVSKSIIAYRTTTNFVEIEPQKKRLLVTLNIRFNEIDDHTEWCHDVSRSGHDDHREVEVSISSLDQIEGLMILIYQAFEKHSEEVYA